MSYGHRTWARVSSHLNFLFRPDNPSATAHHGSERKNWMSPFQRTKLLPSFLCWWNMRADLSGFSQSVTTELTSDESDRMSENLERTTFDAFRERDLSECKERASVLRPVRELGGTEPRYMHCATRWSDHDSDLPICRLGPSIDLWRNHWETTHHKCNEAAAKPLSIVAHTQPWLQYIRTAAAAVLRGK